MTRLFHDEDVPAGALEGETVAVLGYGIQGRAQALNLRDSGVEVAVGNRADAYRRRAEEDGFEALDLGEAARRGTVVLLLVPDEAQPKVYARDVAPQLDAGDALVFAHGFAVRYDLIEPPEDAGLLLLAPRLPGRYLRGRYLEGWGVPAFVAVERDASGRAWDRLLGLSGALGITRCAAIESSFAEETELDHFSEHVTYPLVFRALEMAFEELTAAGFPPEVALMELHGSGELGEVLGAASVEGLYGMLESHASPACRVGIAHHWPDVLGPEDAARWRMAEALDAIRSGRFARHLRAQQAAGHPSSKPGRKAGPTASGRPSARSGAGSAARPARAGGKGSSMRWERLWRS